MEQLLLSINDAADCLGVGRTKIYELVASGDLTLVKLGRKSLITDTSIKGLVARISEAADAIAS